MKKLLFSVILFIGMYSFVNAQGVDLGIKAGVNMATLGGDVEEVDMKAGLHVGAFLNLNVTDNFAISPEVLFSQLGGKSEGEKLNLNYVNVPVLAKIKFARVLNLHFGPQFGFLMSAMEDDIDVKEGFKSLDINGVAGLGVDAPFGLTGGLRYNFGLGNIMETVEIPGIESPKITNQFFQVYVGYRLF